MLRGALRPKGCQSNPAGFPGANRGPNLFSSGDRTYVVYCAAMVAGLAARQLVALETSGPESTGRIRWD
jgi:hypothetical protein